MFLKAITSHEGRCSPLVLPHLLCALWSELALSGNHGTSRTEEDIAAFPIGSSKFPQSSNHVDLGHVLFTDQGTKVTGSLEGEAVWHSASTWQDGWSPEVGSVTHRGSGLG